MDLPKALKIHHPHGAAAKGSRSNGPSKPKVSLPIRSLSSPAMRPRSSAAPLGTHPSPTTSSRLSPARVTVRSSRTMWSTSFVERPRRPLRGGRRMAAQRDYGRSTSRISIVHKDRIWPCWRAQVVEASRGTMMMGICIRTAQPRAPRPNCSRSCPTVRNRGRGGGPSRVVGEAA